MVEFRKITQLSRVTGHLIKVMSLPSGSMTSISVSEFRSSTFSDIHFFIAYKHMRCLCCLHILNYDLTVTDCFSICELRNVAGVGFTCPGASRVINQLCVCIKS